MGWIVDGQQRAAALRNLKREKFPVSIIGIETLDHNREREQFVLVNKYFIWFSRITCGKKKSYLTSALLAIPRVCNTLVARQV